MIYLLALLLLSAPDLSGWRTREGPHLKIMFPPEAERSVDSIWPRLEPELSRVSAHLQTPIPNGITVVFAPNQRVFSDLQGRAAPDWVTGMAYPERSLIYLRPLTGEEVRANSIRAVIAHELSHVVLHRRLNGNPAPLWFDEGLAVFLSNEPLYARAERLLPLGLTGRSIPLRQLQDSFPADSESSATAYAEAGDFVRFLHDRYGDAAVSSYLDGLARGADPDDALKAAFHASLFDLEIQWLATVRRTYGLIPALSGGGLLWFLISILAIVAYLRKRSTSRKKLALMQLEERYLFGDPPAPAEPDPQPADDDDDDSPPFRALH
jgi:hypothetical protein